MENEKNRGKKKKRRVRWGRVIIFLFIMVVLVCTLSWAIYSVYLAGKSVYQDYNTFVDDFERKKSLQTKFQNGRFTDYTNILLLGIDDGDVDDVQSGRHSDTVIVASINNKTGFINLLSIPRDTKVNIPGRKTEEKINQAYYYGGVQLAVRTVEEVLQMPMQHYIVVDMKVVTDIINILGGIYLYIETDMDYEDPYAEIAIHLKKGYQYLSGEDAINYIRYRSDELGDIGRVQRQQKFLKAIYADFFRIDMITKLPDLFDVINRRVTTSMAVLDTVYIVKSLSGCNPDLIKTEMLPGNFSTVNQTGYWSIDNGRLELLLDEMFKNEKQENKV